jgi:hypothetical protein
MSTLEGANLRDSSKGTDQKGDADGATTDSLGTESLSADVEAEVRTSDVVGINRHSIFTLAEARALFPVVHRLTKACAERVQELINQIEDISRERTEHTRFEIEPLEAEASRLIQDWQLKIQKLGGLPKGLWIVDFDSGSGYFCWKYPEASIEFCHAYRDGYTKRRRISDDATLTLNEPT